MSTETKLKLNHWLWGRAGKAWGAGHLRRYRLLVRLAKLTDPLLSPRKV